MNDCRNVPNELKEYKNWVCWRTAERDGKPTKIPVSITGENASATDSSTWTSFEKAREYYENHDEIDGTGFVFSDDDPFCGIDLDKCRNLETGEIDADAQKIIQDFASYAEISPSGKGVHIIIKGKKKGTKARKGKIEIYDSGRYFTMTGNVLNEHRKIENRQEKLDALYDSLFAVEGVGHASHADERKSEQAKPKDVFLDDQALIEKAKNAKDGAKFTALWEGDISGYKSQSEADLALCCLLAFWTGGDYERIDRLFQQSGLFRADKWSEREDYRERTINAALEMTTEFYDPNYQSEQSQAVHYDTIPTGGFVTADNHDKVLDAVTEQQASPEILFTDGWNAKRFVQEHGNDVRYCHEWGKWLVYDGKRWAIDRSGEVMRMAKETIKRLYVKAAKTDNDIERKLLADHAKKSDSNYKYEAMLNLAKCEVPILPEEMDVDMMLLNVNNGTIDLRTGKLREHRRDDFITKQSSVDYVSGASCFRWLSFLGRIMNNNTNLIEFLQRAIGYALTGDIGEQTLFFLYGTGANGKTVFLESIKGMLGDYAKEAEPEILIQKRNDSHPTGVADLMGARFVSTTEVGEGRRMDEVKVKQLTGGDRLKARFMRQDFFEFYPTHKIFLAANHKPIIRGTDLAIWRRIRLVPFEVTIPEQERIPLAKMLAMLKSEWSGILAWAVQGCLAWQEHGLGVPLEVEKATQAYRDEMDVLTNFFDECCVIHENAWVNSAKLWNAYLAWTKENEEQYPLGRRAFGNRLTARGFISEQAKIVGKNQRIWRGVGLAVEPDTKYEEGVI